MALIKVFFFSSFSYRSSSPHFVTPLVSLARSLSSSVAAVCVWQLGMHFEMYRNENVNHQRFVACAYVSFALVQVVLICCEVCSWTGRHAHSPYAIEWKHNYLYWNQCYYANVMIKGCYALTSRDDVTEDAEQKHERGTGRHEEVKKKTFVCVPREQVSNCDRCDLSFLLNCTNTHRRAGSDWVP